MFQPRSGKSLAFGNGFQKCFIASSLFLMDEFGKTFAACLSGFPISSSGNWLIYQPDNSGFVELHGLALECKKIGHGYAVTSGMKSQVTIGHQDNMTEMFLPSEYANLTPQTI